MSRWNQPQFVPAIVLVFGITSGVGFGVGSYTFVYARGASYLGNDPATCANCHIMKDHYDAYSKGSHHSVATCNDCHVPHNILGKYFMKGLNGYHHSWAFTTGRFHQPIQITDLNRRIAEQNCRYCHLNIVQMIENMPGHVQEKLECIHCHASVGHME